MRILILFYVFISMNANAASKAKYSPVVSEISVSELEFQNNAVNEVKERGKPTKSEAVASPTKLPDESDVGFFTRATSFFSGLAEEYIFTKKERKSNADLSPGLSRAGTRLKFNTECSIENVLAPIRNDLEQLSRRDARNARYFNFHHYFCQSDVSKQIKNGEYEDALNILLNSLSWSSKLVKATAINEERTIFRIDLTDYKRAIYGPHRFIPWDDQVWKEIISFEPYHLLQISHPILSEIQEYTFEEYPVIRGDWFIANASRSPLYDKILGYEGNVSRLLEILEVNIRENIQNQKAMRAGFKSSGVSNFNRLLERHPIKYGAFWLSYDFAGSSGKKSFFKNPLGPDLVKRLSFEHDGGEIIFNLPNGLQAYKLINAEGDHLDVGPSEVVKHSVSSDGRVQNAVSCMGCHSEGILDKDDEVLESVTLDRANFTSREFHIIQSLYPGAKEVKEAMKDDRERYQDALSEIVDKERPGSGIVFNLTRYYEETVTAEAMAAELGISLDQFSYISLYSNFRDTFGVLLQGGKIMRSEIENIFSSEFGKKEDLIFLIQLTRKRINTSPAFGELYAKENFIQALREARIKCSDYIGAYADLLDCLTDELEDIAKDELEPVEKKFVNSVLQMCNSKRIGDVFMQALCIENFVKFAGIVPLNSNIISPICRDLPDAQASNFCESRLIEYSDREVL